MRWFDTTGSDAFAREISEEFVRNGPAGSAASATKAGQQRLLHAIEVIGNRAAKYHRQQPLGWYRKAQFLKTIKETLLAARHDKQLVDEVVYAIAVRMARRDEPMKAR